MEGGEAGDGEDAMPAWTVRTEYVTTAFCPGRLGGRFAFTEIRSSNLVGGGLVYALRFVGSASLASPCCASALTLPAPPCRGLSLRSGVCPAVPSSGASPGLIKSSPSCLADFLALSRPPCLLRAPCGRALWFTRALAAPETGRTGRVRGAGVRSRRCSGGDAVSGVTPLRAGSLQVSCVPLGLPGTLRRPVWLELLS